MQLFHGRLLAVLPVLILAIITVMPVAHPTVQRQDRALAHSSIHPRALLALRAPGDSSDPMVLLKQWLDSVIIIMQGNDRQLERLLDKALVSRRPIPLDPNLEGPTKITRGVNDLVELFRSIELETRQLKLELDHVKGTSIPAGDWMWGKDMTAPHPDFPAVSKKLCRADSHRNVADELHRKLSDVIPGTKSLEKLNSWQLVKQFRDTNERIFMFITGLRVLCTHIYPDYAVSPELQTLGIFKDIFGSANLGKLLHALEVTTAETRISQGSSSAISKAVSRLTQRYKDLNSGIQALAKQYGEPAAHPNREVEMWKAPNESGGSPVEVFFAISKQLCYHRPGLQDSSDGHLRVKNTVDLVDTIKEIINGAPLTGPLKFIATQGRNGERTSEKLWLLHDMSGDFCVKVDRFCKELPSG